MWFDCDTDGDDIQSRHIKGHGGTLWRKREKNKQNKTKQPENGRQQEETNR